MIHWAGGNTVLRQQPGELVCLLIPVEFTSNELQVLAGKRRPATKLEWAVRWGTRVNDQVIGVGGLVVPGTVRRVKPLGSVPPFVMVLHGRQREHHDHSCRPDGPGRSAA